MITSRLCRQSCFPFRRSDGLKQSLPQLQLKIRATSAVLRPSPLLLVVSSVVACLVGYYAGFLECTLYRARESG